MRGETPPFTLLDNSILLLSHLPPHTSGPPWHPMLPPLSLLLPSTTGHKWPRSLPFFYAMACQRRAPEHAIVLPRTIAALCPSHPTTSSLPLAPVEVPRRPQHATPLAPSSFSLLLPPFARAPAARELQWACSHARYPDDPPLLLSLPLAVDHAQEDPRLEAKLSRGLQQWLRPHRRMAPWCTSPSSI